MQSELGGDTQDMVGVVYGRRGRSSAELLGTWLTWSRSTWSELGGARSAAQRGLLDGSLRLANGSDSLFDGLESYLGDDVAVGDLVVMR